MIPARQAAVKLEAILAGRPGAVVRAVVGSTEVTGHTNGASELGSMQALVIERPGSAAVVQLDRPRPGHGDVLVRVRATGICGSDVELLEGRRPAPYARYPIVPGHEWAGTVAATGPGVSGLAPGDAVVAEGFRSCGTCARCREGLTNLCAAEYSETGFTEPGACAEYVCVPSGLVHRLPPGTDLEAAALLEPAACVAQGLFAADLRPGLSVAVVGAGTLGLLAVSLLRLTSPHRLAVAGTRARRLALAGELGADEVADVRAVDPVARLGRNFDLVFEATNRPQGSQLALQLARRGGTVVLEGISGSEDPALTPDLISLGHLRVQGVFGASRAAWRWVVELFADGKLDPSPLVTHRFPLADFQLAFAALRDPEAGALKVELVSDGALGATT
jgi:2-desacetyl-2-hydroxyethyl bacteriochlorophyllide A dehydrogenase